MQRLCLVLVFATALCAATVVMAHAHLAQSEPADNDTVSTGPAHFTLKFSESAHLTALSVQREGDATAQKITGLPKEARRTFTIPAPKLAAGRYTMNFRNVAADDNHVTSGTIHFTVATGAK